MRIKIRTGHVDTEPELVVIVLNVVLSSFTDGHLKTTNRRYDYTKRQYLYDDLDLLYKIMTNCTPEDMYNCEALMRHVESNSTYSRNIRSDRLMGLLRIPVFHKNKMPWGLHEFKIEIETSECVRESAIMQFRDDNKSTWWSYREFQTAHMPYRGMLNED